MDLEWKSFLIAGGAVFEDDELKGFGQPEPEARVAVNGNVLIDLSTISIIRVSGADAQTFLQSQLTNDVRAVDAAHTQLSAYCTAKGRMLAIFRIVQQGGDYLLLMPSSLCDDIVRRLRMYVLRAKVTLASEDDAWQRFAIAGPEAERRIQDTFSRAPDIDGCIIHDQAIVLRVPGAPPRFQILAPTKTAQVIWRSLQAGATPVSGGVWRWLDVHAGIPTIFPQTSEAFVPQMMNLELIAGVNFQKGCYPGQEIVARMHYLGRLKQRMYRLHTDTASAVQPGDAVFASNTDGQSVGTVVDAQPAPDAGYDLLAVVQIAAADGSTALHLGLENGSHMTLQPLPYSVVLS